MSVRVLQRDGYTVIIKGTPHRQGVIKDVRCSACGHESTAIVRSVAWEAGRLRCSACGRSVRHEALATGGENSRYYYADIEHAPDGHVRYLGLDQPETNVLARDDDGHWRDTGERVEYHDPDFEAKKAAGKYSAEAREERRQQIKSDKRRKRGREALFFDGGK